MSNKNLKVHFSSLKQNWKTPVDFYEGLNKEFDFNFDPCPLEPDFDGLSIEWKERNFINPPYSEIKDWVKKCYDEANKGKL